MRLRTHSHSISSWEVRYVTWELFGLEVLASFPRLGLGGSLDWVKVVFGGVTNIKELVTTSCPSGGVVSPSACVCSLVADIFVFLGRIVTLRTHFPQTMPNC